MKSPALLALILAFSSPLLSAEIPEIKCRKIATHFEDNLSPSEIVEKDLLQGIWISKNEMYNSEKRYQFNEVGTVDIISIRNNETANYKQALWHTETFEEKALLVWKEPGECERFLKIDQTCEGIILSDIANEKDYFLTYTPKINKSKIDFIKNNLFGDWGNVTYPFDIAEDDNDCGSLEIMKGAFLNYHFDNNGSYVKKWGNAKKAFKETGNWEISKDGNHILLNIQQKNGKVTRKDVARIKLIDMDKLVLEQSLHSPNHASDFCTVKKDFVFVK